MGETPAGMRAVHSLAESRATMQVRSRSKVLNNPGVNPFAWAPDSGLRSQVLLSFQHHREHNLNCWCIIVIVCRYQYQTYSRPEKHLRDYTLLMGCKARVKLCVCSQGDLSGSGWRCVAQLEVESCWDTIYTVHSCGGCGGSVDGDLGGRVRCQ